MRSLLAGAAIGLLALIGPASPVLADPAGPTDYRSEVVSIEPASEQIDVRIIGGDSFVELVARPGTEVTVIGYRGEPYLWFRPDGSVLENRNSPTTFLNESRYGSDDVPAGVDPDGAPDWKQIGSDHRWAWHDHRAHWMQPGRPLGSSEGDQILEAVIPLEVDGQDVSVTVESTWMPAPSALPVWFGGLAGVAVVVGGWWSGRRGRFGSVWPVPVAVLTLLVGVWQYTSLPSETGPRVVWWALPAIATACAIGGMAAGLTGRRFWADAAMLVVGVELAVWGWLKRDGLWAALVPTGAPGWLDRFTVALALVAGVGFGAVALWSLFGVRQADRVSAPTAPTGSPHRAHP